GSSAGRKRNGRGASYAPNALPASDRGSNSRANGHSDRRAHSLVLVHRGSQTGRRRFVPSVPRRTLARSPPGRRSGPRGRSSQRSRATCKGGTSNGGRWSVGVMIEHDDVALGQGGRAVAETPGPPVQAVGDAEIKPDRSSPGEDD